MNFFKYSANGNDFILLVNPELIPSHQKIQHLCSRHFGIGADGVLILTHGLNGIRMRIFNSDGHEADMCANGLRIAFTHLHGLGEPLELSTRNGFYSAQKADGKIKVEMTEIAEKNFVSIDAPGFLRSFYVSTGVPHIVLLTQSVSVPNFRDVILPYRHHPLLPKGANVNLVEILSEERKIAKIRTFERGVEDETLSCGTGLTASALALNHWFQWEGDIQLQTRGGEHLITLGEKVFFSGDVTFCFQGEIEA